MTLVDEYLDIVDRDDVVISKKLRSEVYAEDLVDFRVINAFIINDSGEIWIPRRSADKRLFPLRLDMSVGGHVESGETYDQAFVRETLEEINLDIATVPWRLMGKMTPYEHGVSAYMQVYEIKSNKSPAYNPADFTEYFWLTPKALLEKLHSGDKGKGDLPKIIKRFFPSAL